MNSVLIDTNTKIINVEVCKLVNRLKELNVDDNQILAGLFIEIVEHNLEAGVPAAILQQVISSVSSIYTKKPEN